MKKLILSSAVFLLFVAAVCPTTAQSAGKSELVRNALTKVMDSKRANSLKVIKKIKNFTVLSDSLSGYAVVTENSKGASVVAYGTRPLKGGNLPDGLEFLLEDFTKAAQANQTNTSSRRKAASYRVPIAPMIQTHWAQSDDWELYNAYCPKLRYTRSSAGCVAVAFGQLLKYHSPEVSKGKRSYYTYNFDGNKSRTESFDFSQSFNWAQMPARLTKSSSNAQKEAVGKLLYACGVATNAMYRPGQDTHAYSDEIITAVNQIFKGYIAEKQSYDLDIVYEELAAKRPVLYTASRNVDGNMVGHVLVIDGCDNKGYLHCNMGWDYYDDYFDPSVMYGLTISPYIITMRQGDNSRFDVPVADLEGKLATTQDLSSANPTDASQWYVLWNAATGTGLKAEPGDQRITSFCTYPAGEETALCAGQLVRFVPAGNSQYYIQTGNGKYLYLTSGGALSTIPDLLYDKTTFSLVKQSDDYAIKSNNGLYLTHSLGHSTIWGNSSLDTNAKAWKIFPVKLTTNPNVSLYKGSTILLQTNVKGLVKKIHDGVVGYPKLEAAELAFGWKALLGAAEYGVTDASYPILNAAYNSVAEVTNVNTPEKGKSYYIRAIFQDATLGYLAHDAAGRLTLSSTPDYAFEVENSNGKVKTFRGKKGYLSVEATDKPSVLSSYVSSYCDLSVAKQRPNAGNNYGSVTSSLLLGCLTLQGVCATGNSVFHITANSQGGFDYATPDQLFFDCTAQNGKYRSCQFRFEEVSAGRLKLEQTGIADELELNSGTVTEQVARDLQGRIVSPANTRGIILQNGKKILR